MSDSDIHLSDIPVYRISEGDYGEEKEVAFTKYFEPIKFSLVETGLLSEERVAQARERFERYQWSPWRFNQVVGWIQLHIVGGRFLAYGYFLGPVSLRAKARGSLGRVRKVLSRRSYQHVGPIFEAGCPTSANDKEIAAFLELTLLHFSTQPPFPSSSWVDLDGLRSISPWIPWRDLLGQSS